MEKILWLDENILLWIQEHMRNDFLTPVFQKITSLGDGGLIWIGITILLLCIPKMRKVGIMSAEALLLSLLINNLWLKNWIDRIRPYEVIDGLELITRRAMDPSFPSGHTAASFSAGFLMWICSREYQKTGRQEFYFPQVAGWLVLLLAVLIGFSRLYVGVHYPTDVLAGTVSGILISLAVFWCNKKRIDKNSLCSG